VAAVALILGVHRLLSSAFVVVNIIGNALATVVIAQWEGAVDRKLLLAGLAEVNSAQQHQRFFEPRTVLNHVPFGGKADIERT
jgi:Na+/H+-dicarboxylate symporter